MGGRDELRDGGGTPFAAPLSIKRIHNSPPRLHSYPRSLTEPSTVRFPNRSPLMRSFLLRALIGEGTPRRNLKSNDNDCNAVA